MSGSKIVVRIVVCSESAAAAQIERAIGLRADRRWEKGDLRDKTIIREKDSGWMLVDEYPLSMGLENAARSTLRRVESVSENLRNLGGGFKKELSVIIYCPQPPEITLSSVFIKALGACDLDFDIDLFTS